MTGKHSYLNMCVPCLFGLEGLCADELRRLGYDGVLAENGRVLFSGGAEELAGANINLRTGERVLLTVGSTKAGTFDEMFEGVRAIPWENYIPVNGEFPVKGHSLSSKLESIPACQKIIKKAVVTRLQAAYKTTTLPETASKYQIQFAIMDDTAFLYLDTSGAGLHKRGYRPVGNAAPLRETLAAAIVKLSRYKGRERVFDPFCGSGTIPIEAALAAVNRAPGNGRSFSAEKWAWLDSKVWSDARAEAKSREYKGEYEIWGGDIDPESIEIAKANAKRAGVAKHIRFEVADATAFSLATQSTSVTLTAAVSSAATSHTAAIADKPHTNIVMTNPPYGERVMAPGQAEALYRQFGTAIGHLDNTKMYILSSHTEFERTFGKRATKKRKLYNGMIKCDLYMYY